MAVFKFKRGTQAEHDNYIGDPGEITVITDDSYRPVVHDGTTSGGFPLAFESELGGGSSPGSEAFKRDFESGDFSNWTIDSGYTVQSNTQLSGTYSLRFDGSGSASGDNRIASTTFTQDTYTKFSWLWQISGQTSNAERPQVRLVSGTTDAMLIGVDSNLNVVTYSGSYVDTGIDVSVGTTYRFIADNIDYSTNEFDVVVEDVGGSTIGSASNQAFWNSASDISEFNFFSAENEHFADDVTGFL